MLWCGGHHSVNLAAAACLQGHKMAQTMSKAVNDLVGPAHFFDDAQLLSMEPSSQQHQ
jgi:hypothetical protein